MNGFELHGLLHVSPSSCNAFVAQPALWVLERLLGHKTGVGASAHRGIACEHGTEYGLFNPEAPVAECVAKALREFDRLTVLSGDPNRQKERDAIPGIVESALAELRQYGIPSKPEDGSRQHKVEIRLEGVPVPVIGFKDFYWPQHNITADLKTELRLTSAIKDAHARQGAVYIHGTNGEMRFCYATPKKCAVYRLEDAREHIEALRLIALTMERFLRLSRDPNELAALLAPDPSHFFFSNPQAARARREVYGY
jgi:hypothetical protein